MSHKHESSSIFLARIFDIILSSFSKSKYFCMELSLSRDSLFKYLFWNRCIQVNHCLPHSYHTDTRPGLIQLFRAAQTLPYSFSHSTSGSDHPSFLSALHPAFGTTAGHTSLPYYQEWFFRFFKNFQKFEIFIKMRNFFLKIFEFFSEKPKQQAYQYGDQYGQYGMHPDDHVTSSPVQKYKH